MPITYDIPEVQPYVTEMLGEHITAIRHYLEVLDAMQNQEPDSARFFAIVRGKLALNLLDAAIVDLTPKGASPHD